MKTKIQIEERIEGINRHIDSLDKQIIFSKTYSEGFDLRIQQNSLFTIKEVLEWVLSSQLNE